MPMHPIYIQFRDLARQILSEMPQPDFYTDCSSAHQVSNHFFTTDPDIRKLSGHTSDLLKDNLGHGLAHAEKVAIEAGTLLLVESNMPLPPGAANFRRLKIIHCAGILHDIRRKDENHAQKGAIYARKILQSYPFSAGEVDDICLAIKNHEAFKKMASPLSREGKLVSDCLYDADKFRWGPDNFAYTVWEMISFGNIPLKKFIAHYPKGLSAIQKIKETFRTATGQKYGPQIIDMGLSVGETLYGLMQSKLKTSA